MQIICLADNLHKLSSLFYLTIDGKMQNSLWAYSSYYQNKEKNNKND